MWWPKHTRYCIELYSVLLQVFYHIRTLMPTYFFNWRILTKGQSYFKKGYFSKKWLKMKTSNQQNLSFSVLSISSGLGDVSLLALLSNLGPFAFLKSHVIWGLWAWHVKHEWTIFSTQTNQQHMNWKHLFWAMHIVYKISKWKHENLFMKRRCPYYGLRFLRHIQHLEICNQSYYAPQKNMIICNIVSNI